MASVPRWFGALLAGGAAGVVGTGIVGLLLAVAGVFVWPVAVVAGAAGALAGGLVGWRVVPDGGSHGWAAAAALVAVVFVAANWNVVGGSVVLERDPGLYSATARWIDRDGSLLVDARVGPFAQVDGLEFVSVGMYDLDGTTLEFQSNHLTPVLFAAGYGAAGVGGMTHVPLLLVAGGLLAVYALALRVTGRAWTALAGIGALAASLPVLGVARDLLTEPVVLLLLWTGLWLWTVAADRDETMAAALAGVCLGACVAARIDSAAYLVPVPIVLALHGRRAGWRLALPLAVGAAPGALTALVDVGLRSRGYLGDLGVEIASLYALLAVAVAASVVVARRRRPVRLPGRTPAVLAGIVVVGLLLGWFVRPHVQTAMADDSLFVTRIQQARGDDVDGRRRYHELSMVWQAWYLGPVVLAAAVAGAGLVVRRLAAGVDRVVLLPMAALGAATGLYLLRPSISPDHLWASRRFVPAALPLWCVLAGVVAVAGQERLPRRPVLRAVAAVVAVGAALSPVVARTWPVRRFQEQAGFVGFVDHACGVVGPDAAVVLLEDSDLGQTFAQTLRSWCGVPVALLATGTGPELVDELASAWRAEGRDLWVLAGDEGQLAEHVSSPEVVTLGPVVNERRLEKTLTSPPDDYEPWELRAVATRAGGG